MLTAIQTKTAQAIVNFFETSAVLGDYGNVTLIAGDTGHLTFGRSQTTLGAGNLAILLDRYCANPGARFGTALTPFLPRFAAKDLALDHERHLHNLLRSSADDPVMRETQDAFLRRRLLEPGPAHGRARWRGHAAGYYRGLRQRQARFLESHA